MANRKKRRTFAAVYEMMDKMTDKIELFKEKCRRFGYWQQLPHQVNPLSDEMHDCTTCGTRYQGNFCPRCGQSAKVGRYSFKTAFLLFLDVWGLGNRGMFRTLRDLLLRPGYMIRDYLQGMQMAYFPPFKMFFLLIALKLLVDSGLNIQVENRIGQWRESFERGLEQVEADEAKGWTIEVEKPDQQRGDAEASASNQESGDAEVSASNQESGEAEVAASNQKDGDAVGSDDDEMSRQAMLRAMGVLKTIGRWVDRNSALLRLLGLLILSWPLYYAFRRCPNIPDLRFSEFFVAVVYTTNMMTIYSILSSFFCLGSALDLLPIVMAVVSMKQLSGYSYWRTALRAVGITAVFLVLMIGLILFSLGFISVLYSVYL
jgi:hypothetical protein